MNVIASKIKGKQEVGGLAGYYASSKPIENSSVKADSIIASSHFGSSGGLVGITKVTLTISNSFAIGNIYAYRNDNKSGGLVGEAKKSLTISNSYASGSVSGKTSGGLVGSSYELIIESCYSNGNVYGSVSSGGLVGEATMLAIENSYTSGNISGSIYYSGGLVGYAANVTIFNSYTSGNVSGKTSGGLVGRGNGSISNSYVSGNVEGNISGGLIGSGYGGALSNYASIFNSYVNGNVSGTISGGLVGNGSKISIFNSYASGNVSASSSRYSSAYSGGLVGTVSDILTISNSYASGYISVKGSPAYSGGLVGEVEKVANIFNSYASGNVEGTASGGIFGIYNGGPIYSSIYYNSDGATQAAGKGSPLGISGISNANMKNEISFKNWDFENIWHIDSKINNGYPYLQIKRQATTPEQALRELVGTWEGSYYAGQGETGLTLDIYEESGRYMANFRFYNLAGKNNVQAGEYKMNVSYNHLTRKYNLIFQEWINRPSGYGSINLIGNLNCDIFFNGRTDYYDNFNVTRKSELNKSKKQAEFHQEEVAQKTVKEYFIDWDFENIWSIDNKINDGNPYLQWSENAIREASAKIEELKKQAELMQKEEARKVAREADEKKRQTDLKQKEATRKAARKKN